MSDESVANLADRDRVERMIFTLPVDDQLLDGLNPTQAAELVADVFNQYLAEVMPYPFWQVGLPVRVEPTFPMPGHQAWQAVFAVLRRVDEERGTRG